MKEKNLNLLQLSAQLQLKPSFWIKELREKRRETVAEFAAVLGVHRDTVYCWEKGEVEPRYENILSLKKLASETNCVLQINDI